MRKLKKKIGIIGHFMFSEDTHNGQSVKTTNYFHWLCDRYDKTHVTCIDTYHFKNLMLKKTYQCFKTAIKSDAVIVMPIKGLIKPLSLILLPLKKIFRFKLICVAVGGWLPEALESDIYSKQYMMKYDAILVEAFGMKDKLEKAGLQNVVYSPNFSNRSSIAEHQIKHDFTEPYKFCTFSRVTRTKGIIDAIEAVVAVNQCHGHIVCCLDIYGALDIDFKEAFFILLNKYSECISYKGVLKGDEIVPRLSNYFGMLFPSYYPGECFPGAVLEGMMAGLPVIASDWKYNSEVVVDNETGFIYQLGENLQLINKIAWMISNTDKTIQIRHAAWMRSKQFTAEAVMQILYDLIG